MEYLTLLLQTVPVLALILFYLNRKFSYWSSRGVVGPRTCLSPLGNLLEFFYLGQIDVDKKWFSKFGKIYGYYRGPVPTLTIADNELIKQVLVKDFHAFVNRGLVSNISNEYVSKNLFNATDDQWRRVRSITSPSFTSGKLKGMHLLMEKCVDKLSDYFNNVIQTKDGQMNIKEIIAGFTIDVIASTSFATETNANDDRKSRNPFVENGIKLFQFNRLRALSFFALPTKIFERLGNSSGLVEPKVFQFFVDLSKEIVKQRHQNSAQNGAKRNDLVQLMMDAFVYEDDSSEADYDKLTATMDGNDNQQENVSTQGVKKKLSETEIIAQCIIFFAAGFETTASTLSNSMYHLALNPEAQDRLYEELTKSLDGVDVNSDKYFELVTNQIDYLDAVIKETLRMNPPVGRLNRQLGIDGYKLAGIPLDKGTQIEISTLSAHYCPDYYSEPEQFKPERFLPENKHLLVPYTYLPFGAGPRNCIGMRFAYQEMKLCLAKIITQFRFERTNLTKVPLEFAKFGILTTKEIQLKISKR